MIRQITLIAFFAVGIAYAGKVDPQQEQYIKKYEKQANVPKAEEMLVNTDKEPDLSEGFVSLFNGKDLEGWAPKGGHSKFEAKDGMIVGVCVAGSPSTYLCTEKNDYSDFVFTCEMKWLAPGNSGVMFRSQTKPGMKKDKKDPTKETEITTVFGPQAEMEGPGNDRGWSGGIYGQSCGGWYYPLWLEAHAEARKASDDTGWNRLTVMAKGDTVKTWVNGVPAAHWVNDVYLEGLFALQVHSGTKTIVHWRNIKVKPLSGEK